MRIKNLPLEKSFKLVCACCKALKVQILYVHFDRAIFTSRAFFDVSKHQATKNVSIKAYVFVLNDVAITFLQ